MKFWAWGEVQGGEEAATAFGDLAGPESRNKHEAVELRPQ